MKPKTVTCGHILVVGNYQPSWDLSVHSDVEMPEWEVLNQHNGDNMENDERNPQDATLRNIRALKKRVKRLEEVARILINERLSVVKNAMNATVLSALEAEMQTPEEVEDI